ncbi:MAG: CDP-alcohol phosphatidyltransferase family protein [Alphaproteobacteria bacterium]
MTDKPWDQHLANIVVRPLAATPVHPNHLTALSFLFGLGAALVFAMAAESAGGWAAGLYMLAVFTDHTDGEFARMTGQTSEFGHRLDYIVGSANYTLLFAGLGIGLAAGDMGGWALPLGLAAAACQPLTVMLRMGLERRHGARAVAHPHAAGFELEDFIYLIGPITWLGGLDYFFVAYSLGAIGYLGWTLWELRKRS